MSHTVKTVLVQMEETLKLLRTFTALCSVINTKNSNVHFCNRCLNIFRLFMHFHTYHDIICNNFSQW